MFGWFLFLPFVLGDKNSHDLFLYRFQQGAKFTAIETKFTSCETLLIYLQKIKDVDPSDSNMIVKVWPISISPPFRLTLNWAQLNFSDQELEEFCQQLDSIQNSLARKLRFINEIKTKENVTKLAQMGNKITKSVERLQANVMRLRMYSLPLLLSFGMLIDQ